MTQLEATMAVLIATAESETAVALSLSVLFRFASAEAFIVVRDVNWDLLLDIHRVRDRDGLRDVHGVGPWNLNVVRHGIRYFHGDLNLIRHLLLDSIRYLLFYHDRVGLGYLYGIRPRDGDMDRYLNFIRDLLLDGNCVGLRDRIWHLLGDNDGSHVFLLMLLTLASLEASAAITIVFKTSLLLFGSCKSKQRPQQSAGLVNENYTHSFSKETTCKADCKIGLK
jgi:hypothetical protein